MKRSTAIFLVCLRLTIGWHFLVEGWHKVHSQLVGPAETSRVFSSEGYFREAPGPLGRLLHRQLGDPDDELLARLTVEPESADHESPRRARIPLALAKDWDDYLAHFSNHYGLDEEQKKQAETRLQKMKDTVVTWLDTGQKEIKKTFPTGDVERVESMPQRIAEYRALREEIRDAYDKKLPLLGRDVEKARLSKAKGELAQLRAGLAADLEEMTGQMKKSLAEVLTPSQKERGDWQEERDSRALRYLNQGTAWGLFAIGAGLLLGLFTRFWCLLAAAFLLLTYLAAPPMPWWPAPPQQEGTYLFVNKNVVEMFALLVLATTCSGRWFGLDAIVNGLFTGFSAKRNCQ